MGYSTSMSILFFLLRVGISVQTAPRQADRFYYFVYITGMRNAKAQHHICKQCWPGSSEKPITWFSGQTALAPSSSAEERDATKKKSIKKFWPNYYSSKSRVGKKKASNGSQLLPTAQCIYFFKLKKNDKCRFLLRRIDNSQKKLSCVGKAWFINNFQKSVSSKKKYSFLPI